VYRGSFNVSDAAADARAQQSASLLAEKKPEEALALAREAVGIAPGNLFAQTALGDAAAAAGDKQGAEVAWQAAISLAKQLEPDAQVSYVPDLEAKMKKLGR